LGLDEINKASLRWQHTKDGKAVYQPSATGSLTSKNIIHDKEIRKSRFEIIRDTVSDLREGHLIANRCDIDVALGKVIDAEKHTGYESKGSTATTSSDTNYAAETSPQPENNIIHAKEIRKMEQI